MLLHYNRKGAARKVLVRALEQVTGLKSTYLGAPTMAYAIGEFTLDKDGVLSFPDDKGSIAKELLQRGFKPEEGECATEEVNEVESKAEEPVGDILSISFPRETLSEEGMERLKNLLEAKSTLLKHAFAADSLDLEVDDEKITFPWFKSQDADHTNAYMLFLQAILKMANEQKRVLGKVREVENEKYAFRCFLLRLGFIGSNYKRVRKILMENLEGCAAFKVKPPKED